LALIPATPVLAKKAPTSLKVGDRVVVASPDAGSWKGARGEVTKIFNRTADHQDCRVQFDKKVRGSVFLDFPASHLMKL
jgi:hypothetical protein